MAALPDNDRIAGPFIAVAGQTDVPADFPLIRIEGLRLRIERNGAALPIETYPDVDAFDRTGLGFTARRAVAFSPGDRVWVYSELPPERDRQHTPNGAVRSATLEADAMEAQAQLQEARRDLGQAIRVAPGETPPDPGDIVPAFDKANKNLANTELAPTSPAVFDEPVAANVILDKPHVPERFGATPGMIEGLADATTVIQRMLDATQQDEKDKLKPLELGAGRFVMDGQCAIDLGNYSGSILNIRGAGNNGTKLVMDRLNRAGGIKINRPNNMEHVHVSDLAFCSVLPQDDFVFPGQPYDPADNNGIGLWITTDIMPGSPGYGVQDDRAVRVERIHFHGIGPNSGEAHYVGVWGEAGVRIDCAWFPIIRDCTWRGVFQPEFETAHVGNNQHCLLLNHNYAPEIEACLFNGYWGIGVANIGLEPDGTPNERFVWRWEGGRIRHCIFGGLLLDGMVLTHNFEPGTTLMSPGFQILDNHVNARRNGVRMNGHRQVQITGNEFYAQNNPLVGAPLQAGVYLSDCGTIDASNNLFDEPGRYVSDDDAWCAYRLENNVDGFHCDDRMAHGGIGVRIGTAQTATNLDISIRKRGKSINGLWAPLKTVVNKADASVFSEEIDQGLWDVKRFVSRTKDTNVSPVFQIDRERGDFGTVTAPKLGAISLGGLNSAGTRRDALWIEALMERNTAGNEASGVIVGGYVNGQFVSFLSFSGSSGQAFMNIGQVIHTSNNSNNVFARPRYELFRDLPNYATVSNARLGEYAFAGKNSAGAKVLTSVMESYFVSNAAANETSGLRFSTLHNGAVVQPLVLQGDHAVIDNLWTGSVTLQGGLTPVGYVSLRDTFGNAYRVMVA